eukprot:gb/GFBE01015326.1/.p1 GENE.gb/GFBE01015326.1/~~gb/GFBE01015326.1/.p1  ORF type:complete len:207 (+),score=34.48 gb/GFBE01015326.1/:1-621(+)
MAMLCKSLIAALLVAPSGATTKSMTEMMCDMVKLPVICPGASGSTGSSAGKGLNSKECQQNPGACCQSVKKCSPTSPFNVMSGFKACPASMGSAASCVGSDPFSPTNTGVCMCSAQGAVCAGTATEPTCSGSSPGSPNSFSRLNEQMPRLGETAASNLGGMLVVGGSVVALAAAVVSGVRRLRQPVDEAQTVELLEQDEEELISAQ